MGDRVSIQFVNGSEKSVVLFSHWGGRSFVEGTYLYLAQLRRISKEHEMIEPLSRLDPSTVMVDYIRYLTKDMDAVWGDLYLGVDEKDGDNSDNGHFLIQLREPTILGDEEVEL